MPDSVLWRTKEAFSDGVSKTSRSLYQIIQDYVSETQQDYIKDFSVSVFTGVLPETDEQIYYRKIFDQHYQGSSNIIPYFWMPKYVRANDASARTLPIYKASHVITSEEDV